MKEEIHRTAEDRQAQTMQKGIEQALAVELGVLCAMVVCVVLALTTRLGIAADPGPRLDAACLLPRMARAIGQKAALDAALRGCGVEGDVLRVEALRVWAAHIEAERVEGFVPRGEGSDL